MLLDFISNILPLKKVTLLSHFGESFISIFAFSSSLGLSLQRQTMLAGPEIPKHFNFLYNVYCHAPPLTVQLFDVFFGASWECSVTESKN